MWQAIKDVLIEFFWRLWGYFTAQPLAKPSTTADGERFPSAEKKEEVLATIEESDLWRELQKREKE